MNILSTILSFYDDPEKNSTNDYNDCFKLPIEYLEQTKLKLLNNNIISDLELKVTKEDESENNSCVYNLYYQRIF
jgi:hypothetical protein